MILDFGRFEALTFDYYGTLIDWESGILAALGTLLQSHGLGVVAERILESFARHEARLEAEPYRRYREVLGECARGVAADHGVELAAGQAKTLAESVGSWPAFPDSAAALARLGGRYRLGVITNCDDDLFAASSRLLGTTFDTVVTAEQVGAYKPDLRNFEVALERLDVPRDRVLHVAQSLFHDHVPARRLGLASVWVNRREGQIGAGATPPAEATPDLVVPDMATLADLALAGWRFASP